MFKGFVDDLKDFWGWQSPVQRFLLLVLIGVFIGGIFALIVSIDNNNATYLLCSQYANLTLEQVREIMPLQCYKYFNTPLK